MLALETLRIIIPHSLQISKVGFSEIKKFRNICSVQVNGAMTHITETKACQGLRIGDPWFTHTIEEEKLVKKVFKLSSIY